MAAAETEQRARRPAAAGVRIRLAEARWLLGAMAALLIGLYLAGTITMPAAVAIFAILAALIAIMPRAPSHDARVPAVEPAAAWAESGIERFAEALPNPCFILDRRGVVRFANDLATATFPIRSGEVLTAKLRVPDLVAGFDRVAKGGRPERVEFVERVPTERWFTAWFAALGAPTSGLPDFVVLLLEDMSERRRSERIRVDFVANASHELRTPLASLAGFIETLEGPAREDAGARERFLAIMHEQADRMSRLVDDLLSLSRIEMKEHLRPSDSVDLRDVVTHLADSLEPLARDLGVTIETRVPDLAAMVTGERDELIQVVENLVENACKYGQSGKCVVITVSPAAGDRGPTVSVRDFGPGIPEEHLPRLTERFYRIDVEISRKHRGTGLGLAIVKHILARHQARMSIESELGKGATFTVTFPQALARGGSGLSENMQSRQSLRLS